jgi:hypothetical protein
LDIGRLKSDWVNLSTAKHYSMGNDVMQFCGRYAAPTAHHTPSGVSLGHTLGGIPQGSS